MNAEEVRNVFGTLSSSSPNEKRIGWGPIILMVAVVGVVIYVSSLATDPPQIEVSKNQ